MIKAFFLFFLIFLFSFASIPVFFVQSSPDLIFGCNTAYSSQASIEDTIRGSGGTTLFTITEDGYAQSITAYVSATTSVFEAKCAIYKHNDLSLVGSTAVGYIDPEDSIHWQTWSFSSPPSLTANTAYVLVIWAQSLSGNCILRYGSGDTDEGHYQSLTYGTFPNPLNATHENYRYSIYCTYTIPNQAPTAPTSLLCEGVTNATGVTDTTPEFSSVFNDPNSPETSNAIEIHVATTEAGVGTPDKWDSGWLADSTSVGGRCADVSYAGTALSLNGLKYYWKCRFRDDENAEGAWSTPASFTMYNYTGVWLTGWSYRKSHNITAATGAGEGYQVCIKTYYGSGTDGTEVIGGVTAGVVYLNSHSQDDFDDVRFADNDGSTLLHYYTESVTANDSAIFWVEIADSLESSNVTIYVYYGNSTVSSASSGSATFLFFDDFSGDLTAWTTVTGTPAISGGQLQLAGTAQEGVYSDNTYSASLRLKFKMTLSYTNKGRYAGLTNNPDTTPTGDDSNFICPWSDGKYYTDTTNEGTLTEKTGGSYNTNAHTYEVLGVSGASATHYVDNALITSQHTTNVPNENMYVYFLVSANDIVYVDDVRLGKYVSPEPAHSTWGTEESPGYAFNLNLRIQDWDSVDNIQNAVVYKDADTKISDANGWANWTNVNGTFQIKVSYYGFWVNGTFSVSATSCDVTMNVRCNLYDVTITVEENSGQGTYLVSANVTVFNTTSTSGNKIKSGVTGSNGQVSLSNLPNNTLTVTMYAGSSYSIVIGNTTQLISSDGQAFTVTANQNYASTTNSYFLIGWIAAVIPLKRRSNTKRPKRKNS